MSMNAMRMEIPVCQAMFSAVLNSTEEMTVLVPKLSEQTALAVGRRDSLARPVEAAPARRESMYHRRQVGTALLALRMSLLVCA